MQNHDSKPWFRAKRFGYGAGLPVAWQGWAALLIFAVAVLVAATLTGPARVAGIVIAVACLVTVTAFRTDGGWHWRWGKRD